jgi:hypothetical protein
MSSNEHLKSAPQGQRSMGNARRLIPRTQALATKRTVPGRGASPATAHDFDNNDDPGPTAA